VRARPHVQHDYFSLFNQSDHCFLVSSLPLPSSLLKLPEEAPTATATKTSLYKIELWERLSILRSFYDGHSESKEWKIYSCGLSCDVVRTSTAKISRRRLADRVKILLQKIVPHVQHDYFSSFNQSIKWLVCGVDVAIVVSLTPCCFLGHVVQICQNEKKLPTIERETNAKIAFLEEQGWHSRLVPGFWVRVRSPGFASSFWFFSVLCSLGSLNTRTTEHLWRGSE